MFAYFGGKLLAMPLSVWEYTLKTTKNTPGRICFHWIFYAQDRQNISPKTTKKKNYF